LKASKRDFSILKMSATKHENGEFAGALGH